ncbi:MAG: penicillin-binding protein 1A, partial [Hyphomicrobiales bacterium]
MQAPIRAPVLPPPQRRKKRKRRKSLLLSFLGFSFAAGVLLFLAGSGAAAFILWQVSKDLPSYEHLEKYEPPVMTRIHAHDGSLIREYARERRIFVPINTVPDLVKNAFLSAEDKRFYEHRGLDFYGIARAVLKAIQNPGGRQEGASTITQQVAKNFLLTSERKIERKLKEAILAIRLEHAFSKDKILELYLNEIYLGIGAYGVAAASLSYFNKELKDLAPEEAAYLAALPKGPNNYHPFRRTKQAIARRNWILDEMAENGFITAEAAAAAKAKPLTVNIRSFGAHVFASDFFAEDVRRTLLKDYKEDGLYGGGLSVRTTLDPVLQRYAYKALHDGLVAFDRSHGWRGPVQQIDISGNWGEKLADIDAAHDIPPWRLGVVLDVGRADITVGLQPKREPNGKLPATREAVKISMDEMKWAGKFRGTATSKGPAPKKPSDVVKVGDVIWVSPKDEKKPQGAWMLVQIPDVGGGLLAMDPHTGRVLAVSGGFSYDISQFDRALQARRQPGSCFKPLVYATALDNGYKPTSIVLDAPIEIESKPGEVWKPENYNKSQSLGPATLRVGIEKSRNQMTARLGLDLGMPTIAEYARRFGAYEELPPLPAMVLGAGETTLIRMVTAYAAFANGGKRVTPTLIDRIQNRWGETIWRHDKRNCVGCKAERWEHQPEPNIPDDRQQIIDPHTAYQVTSILEGVVKWGTATIVKTKFLPNIPVAGKTGTTNDSKDTWF